MQRQWIFPGQDSVIAARRLSGELGLPEFVARVMLRNGLGVSEVAAEFLQPRLRKLGDPFALPEMDRAVNRLRRAIQEGERIVLFGDYDVDGVSSLALLHRVLSAAGARTACFLPLRAGEGYGLSASAVERCFAEHSPQLLIAVDCGTNSVAEISAVRRRGADAIILDHHEVSAGRPDCTALVNPKLGTDFHYLCSAGVCFKLLHALFRLAPVPSVDLREYLDLVALATIADLVPLAGDNRILVHRGLRQIARTRWPGLSALLAAGGVRAPVRGGDVSFRLAPRLNASGRLGTASDSLQLLLTDDSCEAARLAASLDRQNRDRQDIERLLIRDVEEWVTGNFVAARDASIVAGRRDWHQGVLGIVAARIMRRHHRPTLLVGFSSDALGKGSGRSIEGLSLVEALGQCATHLERFGGHDMAAGVTVHEERFEEFRRAFEVCARRMATGDVLTPKLHLDAELPVEDISLRLLEVQELLEPFGTANRQPVFATRGVTPAASPRVLKEKHLRIEFAAGRRKVPAVYFNGAAEALPRPPWDVAFTAERNEFNGRVDAQIQIVAIRAAA